MHQPGETYLIKNTTLLLASFQLGGKDYAVLINLENGNRWVDPVKVNNYCRIKEDEFEAICGYDTYKLIK